MRPAVLDQGLDGVRAERAGGADDEGGLWRVGGHLGSLRVCGARYAPRAAYTKLTDNSWRLLYVFVWTAGITTAPCWRCWPKAASPARRGTLGLTPAHRRPPHRGAGERAGRAAVHPLGRRPRARPTRRWRCARTPRRWPPPPRRWCAPPPARRDAVRGVVRITAADVVGVEVLPPILTGFHERLPGGRDRAGALQPAGGPAAPRGRHRRAHGPPDPRRAAGAGGSARCGSASSPTAAISRRTACRPRSTIRRFAAIGFDRDLEIAARAEGRGSCRFEPRVVRLPLRQRPRAAGGRCAPASASAPARSRSRRARPRPGAGAAGPVPLRHGGLGRHARGPARPAAACA